MPIRSTVRATKNISLPFFRPSAALYSTQCHLIPKLKVLDTIVQTAKNQGLPNLDKTVFIGVQHLLETTATLFQALIDLGVPPHNMFFSGKCYSTAPEVVRTIQSMGINILPGTEPVQIGGYQAAIKADVSLLWQQFERAACRRDIERVVILDDGGHCIEVMPCDLPFNYLSASIEQTRGGLYSNSLGNLMLPLIEVASAAIKKQIESPMIAQAVLNRLKKLLPNLHLGKRTVCGVVGNGAIGSAVAKYLLSLGQTVLIYDENIATFQGLAGKKLVRVPHIPMLIANCSHVFSCTGRDITKDVDILEVVENDISLISCTSEDKEFLSLLQKLAEEGKRFYFEPLADIICLGNRKHKISILKSGFPINFDRSVFSVPSKDIAITRALLLGAAIQAILTASKPIDNGATIYQPERQMLDPYLQQFALKEWLKQLPTHDYSQELLQNFNNLEWIVANSGGVYKPNLSLSSSFGIEVNNNKDEDYKLSLN